tara:strand:- start:99 stop:236 length:138 start_codon:yes stop_codon:yes gene_type:complete
VRAVPQLQGGGSEFAVMIGWNVVAWNVKEVGEGVMDGDEPLEMSG